MSACELCGGDPDAPVTARWTVWLPVRAPSQNRLGGNHGAQRFAYKSFRDRVQTLLTAWARKGGAFDGFDKATGKRRVTFTRVFSGRERRMDPANLVGGMKACVDSMVRAGVLKDDSEKYLEAYYRQERGDRSGVRVHVEELA